MVRWNAADPPRAPGDEPRAAAWRNSNAQEAQGNGLPATARPHGAEQPALLSRPLIGRLSERDAIERLVAGGGSESGVLLLLLGEPGIGKTTLLDHFAGRAEASGFQVLRGRCYEAEMVRPYGLWLDTLRGIAQDAVPPGEARAGGAAAGGRRTGWRVPRGQP
ncbi:AAA family ATPase [Cupriavidus basilensis]